MNINTKKCPYCAEEINVEAIKCRYCGEMLAARPDPSEFVESSKKKEEPKKGSCLKMAIGVTLTLLILSYLVKTDSVDNIQSGNRSSYKANPYDIPKIDKPLNSENLERALKNRPDEFGAEYYYGRGLGSEKVDLEEALVDFTKAIQLDPRLGKAYYARGMIFIILGLSKKGCDDLHQAGVYGINEAVKFATINCK